MRMLIIGGVAAGLSAASKIRRLSPDAQITVFEKGQTISYGACGLPYYVAGINDDPNKMLIRSADTFREQGIEIKTGHQAVRVSAKDKTVLVRGLEDGSMTVQSFDKLLIAVGAEAIRPPIEGVNCNGVHTLKTLDDGLSLHSAVADKQRIVVVGGGFIGVEVAETLQAAGKQVRLIEAAPHILAPFDAEIREILQQRMLERGISINLSEALEAILPNNAGHAAAIRTSKGEYPADIVVLALGVRPVTGFLADTGIRRLPNGAILVDREMRTNLPDIFAAGDCATVYDRVLQDNSWLALGTIANKCGRIAGENMAGGRVRFDGCLGSAAIKVCGLEAARTGMSEDVARKNFPEIATVFIKSNDRPKYYPDPTPLFVKLTCEKRSRRILGGQVVGEKGAVLRVDALAVAITAGLTAPELGMTDFCYAPPFAEVWDALNIAGNAVK